MMPRRTPDQPVLVQVFDLEWFTDGRATVVMGHCRSEYDGTRGMFRLRGHPDDFAHIIGANRVLLPDGAIKWTPGGYVGDPPKVYVDDKPLFGVLGAEFTPRPA